MPSHICAYMGEGDCELRAGGTEDRTGFDDNILDQSFDNISRILD